MADETFRLPMTISPDLARRIASGEIVEIDTRYLSPGEAIDLRDVARRLAVPGPFGVYLWAHAGRLWVANRRVACG